MSVLDTRIHCESTILGHFQEVRLPQEMWGQANVRMGVAVTSSLQPHLLTLGNHVKPRTPVKGFMRVLVMAGLEIRVMMLAAMTPLRQPLATGLGRGA